MPDVNGRTLMMAIQAVDTQMRVRDRSRRGEQPAAVRAARQAGLRGLPAAGHADGRFGLQSTAVEPITPPRQADGVQPVPRRKNRVK